MSDHVVDVGPEADDARFAANMASLRERSNISQADLVRILREGGWASVHQTTISRIEKGERPVRLGEARAIARALNVELAQLILTPADSLLAGRLAWATDRARGELYAISDAAQRWYEAIERLDKVIREAAEQGFSPTPQPSEQHIPNLASSGSVEDEYANAMEIAKEDPEGWINVGRSIYKTNKARRSK